MMPTRDAASSFGQLRLAARGDPIRMLRASPEASAAVSREYVFRAADRPGLMDHRCTTIAPQAGLWPRVYKPTDRRLGGRSWAACSLMRRLVRRR
jgi:hypothetical protein